MLNVATSAADTLVLASGEADYTPSLVSFAWIMAAALLAPLVSFMLKNKMPAVALLILFGMILGPSVLDLAHEDPGIGMLKELGVGALFLLAGFEIDLATLKSKQAVTGFSTWFICMVACLVGAYFLLDDIPSAIVMAIALTSTALGTITPMLKQDKLLGTKVGNSVVIHGAIGEVAPITAMALLLGTRSTLTTMLILLAFIIIAVVVAVMPRALIVAVPWLKTAFLSGAGSTNQTILRLIILILAILMAVTSVFELDIVLGAFAAGIILNRIIPDEFHKRLETRLDVVCYSMLIPVFFVVSGMAIDWHVIANSPLKVIGIPALILVTRGLPVFLRENIHHTGSDIETTRERLQVALYAATGLPIIVAVMTIAVSSKIVDTETASIFVAGGALTVVLFPLLSSLVKGKQENEPAEPKPQPESKQKKADH
ncbi:cation:proton antiporter [Corynebacterium simulans]|uniref:Sodium:proton antiporter n=1 Tax=Corynebacterium accolens TaxID=38284 RepID=A0A2A4AJ79_9CORY|nr:MULTISPECIES: cation:proton antiporter [Corynebacterium]MCG7248076.1 cation:proton antiporter [Corynebacterium simulans]OFQ47857.1 sodium:proton antiporter [Corynebacterium sp. HMSC076D02]PCC82424.1 sodium:proton antiporter [Corynebacterium accolens]GKH18022.1 potassium transporter Kef [Corynebacterium striatum]